MGAHARVGTRKKSSLGSTLHPHQETERICPITHFNRQNNNVTNFSGHTMVRGATGTSQSAAQCPVQTDRKRPDSSIPGFQQEVAMLEIFRKNTFFISIKIYCWNRKGTVCTPKIFLKAWHPDLWGFHCFLWFRFSSHLLKLLSSNSVICYYMNEGSHLK